MKTAILLFSFLTGLNFAQAEVITCTGRTNDPNTTVMDFQVDITGKPDKFTGNSFYKSIITYTLPDGSILKQGIDLNGKPRTKINKIIYSGSLSDNYLELSFGNDGSLQSSVLNQGLKGMIKLPVQCELGGSLPERPVCTEDIDKNKSLLSAITNSGNLDEIDTAVACGADVNKADKYGCTPLMFAVDSTCGHPENIHYQSPFAKASQIIDYLIENGAFVVGTDKQGETALIKAAKYGLRDVYSSFVAAEADFDAQDSLGNTALMYAVYNGDAWTVEQILEGNPNRTLKNKKGQTAYDIAKTLDRTEIADLVRNPDTSVLVTGKPDGSCSPLQISLKQGQVVEFALKASDKMFKFDAKTLELDLMAEANTQVKKIIMLQNKGTYSFTCGFHGGAQASQGKITVQ